MWFRIDHICINLLKVLQFKYIKKINECQYNRVEISTDTIKGDQPYTEKITKKIQQFKL